MKFSGNMVCLRLLQDLHAGTTLLLSLVPPRARGITWSMDEAGDPQYAHAPHHSAR